ncbi:MAG: hypothetical protein ALAOOOJD_01027 [bacterium]|nr:hypothetical protein [bacterium]
MICPNHAGADGRGGENSGNTAGRIQRADAAAEAPRDAHVLFVIVIRIETAGVHRQRLAGLARRGVDFGRVAIGAGQDFNAECQTGSYRNRAGIVVRGCRMIRGNHAGARRFGIKRC